MNIEQNICWKFLFFLEAQDGRQLDRVEADRFLLAITELAELSGLQIGGGIERPSESDSEAITEDDAATWQATVVEGFLSITNSRLSRIEKVLLDLQGKIDQKA